MDHEHSGPVVVYFGVLLIGLNQLLGWRDSFCLCPDFTMSSRHFYLAKIGPLGFMAG